MLLVARSHRGVCACMCLGNSAQLYDLETQYLSASAECGSVLRGFESYLTASTKSGSHAKRQGTRHFKPEERLFSLSSTTSPAGEVDDTLQ